MITGSHAKAGGSNTLAFVCPEAYITLPMVHGAHNCWEYIESEKNKNGDRCLGIVNYVFNDCILDTLLIGGRGLVCAEDSL